MRVSTMMMYNTAIANLAKSAERMEEIQEVITSLKKINRLSDDPIGVSRVVDYQSQLNKLGQYKNNIASGQAWLGLSDSVLLDMQNLVTEAKTIAIAQSTTTASRETRAAAAVQVHNLYEQLVSYANTKLGGSYIFGGSITNRAPFNADGTYNGNSDDILVEIAEGIKAKINVAGSQFLITDLNPALSTAPATAGSTSSSGLVARNSNSIAANPAALSTYRVSFILTNGLRQEITYTTDDSPTRDELGANIAAAVNSNDTLSQDLRAEYDAGTGVITFLAREAGEGGNAFAIDANNTTAFEGAVNTSFAGGSLDIPADLNVLAGVNDSFSITVDGTASGVITLAPGAYSATDLASLMQSRINADPLLSAAGVAVSVDYGITREGQFTITSDSTGVNSRVSLTSVAGRDLLQSIGLDRDFEVAGTTPTLLADLNGGAGVTAGTVTITDRAGNTAAIDLAGAVTIADVISTINASAINVTAMLNGSGNGIDIIDTTGFPIQNLVVEDSATARDLGIIGNKPGAIHGTDLNPALSSATRVSALRGNTGLSLDTVQVINGLHHESIDLGRAGSIGDILNAFNTLGVDITASINPASRASLDVVSDNPDSTALVNEAAEGSSASDLGVQGGANVFKTLSALEEALEKNDSTALLSMLDQFDRILDTLVEKGSEVGVRTNQLEAINNRIKTSETELQKLKSDIEDADMIEYLTKFSLQQTALEAILTAAGQSLQLSLLNFLR